MKLDINFRLFSLFALIFMLMYYFSLCNQKKNLVGGDVAAAQTAKDQATTAKQAAQKVVDDLKIEITEAEAPNNKEF